MNVLFLALLAVAIILFAVAAAPTDRVPAWAWYGGVTAVALAAMIAVANGWATSSLSVT